MDASQKSTDGFHVLVFRYVLNFKLHNGRQGNIDGKQRAGHLHLGLINPIHQNLEQIHGAQEFVRINWE